MKIKKVLVLIMAICLSVSLFAACGGDEGGSEATKSPASKSPASQAPATESPATEAPATETPTVAPTEEPTKEPVPEDPEVDAKLFRFHVADKYMWDTETFITSDDSGVGQTALGTACNYWYEDGEGLAIEVLLVDPYFTLPNTGENGEEFSLADYPIFKVRLKNETLAPKFEAFIGAAAHVAPGDEFQIEISSEDTEYKDYVVNLAEIKGQSYIDGRTTVGSIRLDGLSISDTELAESDSAILYVDYFGFFKTVEDANAWNPAHVAPVEAPATTEAPVEG